MGSFTCTARGEPAKEGDYNVSVPALPGCFMQADTYERSMKICTLHLLMRRLNGVTDLSGSAG